MSPLPQTILVTPHAPRIFRAKRTASGVGNQTPAPARKELTAAIAKIPETVQYPKNA